MTELEMCPTSTTTNHTTATLSALDRTMVVHVPPGGNWKNIPSSIPSKRLEQIRESYARGGGSRSTYYGRLKWDAPAYTISTCFNRPGNGCNIHPSADRLITVREAARLQSFPDSYHFYGSRVSVYKQVGNAVPPLLAFALSFKLGIKTFIDLYCGAGGLSLGFEMAGAQPLMALDSDPDVIETYSRNRREVGSLARVADLSKPLVKQSIQQEVSILSKSPDAVIGGPPCQGFSHAGNARSMADPRNSCVWDFIELVRSLGPRVAVMENVQGLLTLHSGKVVESVRRRFAGVGYQTELCVLHADRFGVPQRRIRVILLASSDTESLPQIRDPTGGRTPTVREAISDLPSDPARESEESVEYASRASTPFQKYVRGELSARSYLDAMVPAWKSFPVSRQSRLTFAAPTAG